MASSIEWGGTGAFHIQARAVPFAASPRVSWGTLSHIAQIRGSAQADIAFRAITSPPLAQTVSEEHLMARVPRIYRDPWWIRPAERYGVRLRIAFLPLTVSDEDGDGVFVASDSFSSVYGDGETPEAAVADYADSLFSHFAYLDQHEALLHSDLRQELWAMRRYVTRVAG